MKLERVKIARLHLHPSNPRIHDDRNLAAIKASLQAFGQQKPIIIDAKNVVIAGNGTVMSAKELGWKEILAQRTKLGGVSAIAYLIADNRCSDLSTFDDPMLAKLLKSIAGSKKQKIEQVGFTESEVNALMESLGETFKPDAETPPRLDRLKTIKCPKCGHEFERYE